MKRVFTILLILPFIAFAQPPEPDSPFIGISHAENDEPPGISIQSVVRKSPAEIAGLRDGDVIIAIDGVGISSREGLTDFLGTHSPGDLLEISVERCGKEERISLILGRRADFQGSMRKGNRTDFPESADGLMPEWRSDSLSGLLMDMVESEGFRSEYEKLAGAFRREMAAYRGYYTLDAVALILLEPAACPAAAGRISSELNLRGGDPVTLAASAGRVLDLDSIPEPEYYPPSSIDALLTAVQSSNAYLDSAFGGLGPDEMEHIADYAPFLLNRFSESVYLDGDSDEDMVDGYLELIDYTKKIRHEYFPGAALSLLTLDDPIELAKLAEMEPGYGADVDRDILLDTMVTVTYADSAGKRIPILGRLLVTGTAGGTYSEEAAIWIDLGGDDTYFGHCGGTPYILYDNYRHRYSGGRSSVHIDLGGNDSYLRNTPGALGGGLCGAGLLLDLSGDDTYSGALLCQGAAFCGSGMLIDRGGSDTYLSGECSQGFATWGVGLLYDTDGDDLYSGSRYVQGVGATKGLGLLVDHSGNDRYTAAFKYPNNYGNAASWEGWSQGVGVGFRSLAAGGIGILCDRAGDDRYEAGNFSQACGYFFGMGMLEDFAGDDRYIGNRYTQGAGAHQAAAFFRDFAGNDSYLGRDACNQGGTWDILISS